MAELLLVFALLWVICAGMLLVFPVWFGVSCRKEKPLTILRGFSRRTLRVLALLYLLATLFPFLLINLIEEAATQGAELRLPDNSHAVAMALLWIFLAAAAGLLALSFLRPRAAK